MIYRSEIDYTEIRRWFFHGNMKELARKLGVSPATLTDHARGRVKRFDKYILLALIDAAIENKRAVIRNSRPWNNWLEYYQQRIVK